MFRTLSWLQDWMRRAVAGVATTTLILSGEPREVEPVYSVDSSMSTLARFPWVATCVRAVAGDLAGLPMIAVRRGPIGAASPRGSRQLVDDRALAMLEQPNASMDGYTFRKQIVVDWLLTGNAYAWRPSPAEIVRIHPAHVRPVAVGVSRLITGFQIWDGAEWRKVPTEQMLWIRDVSWSQTLENVLGESVIRALHDDLSLELAAKQQAREQASKGRPDLLASVDGPLGPNGADEIDARYEQARRKRSGIFSFGRGVKVTEVGWSPEQFEYESRLVQIRDTVLALFEVTPARAGLVTANYGTDRQQSRTYWGSLVRRARIFDNAWSRLAAPGVRVEHDFRDVEALQISYAERQERVIKWISAGMAPADAARLEGFVDAAELLPSEPLETQPNKRPVDRPAEEPQGDRRSVELADALHRYLTDAAPRYEHLVGAADAAAETGLVRQWEIERLFELLTEQRIEPSDARWWAEALVAEQIEAMRIEGGELSSEAQLERCRVLAEQIRASREAA